MSELNKQIVQRAKEILKGFGHEVQTGHLYELFSQLQGFKSWNVAKAKGAEFIHTSTPEPVWMDLQVGKYYEIQDSDFGCAYIEEIDKENTTAIGKILRYLPEGVSSAACMWDMANGKALDHDKYSERFSIVVQITDPEWHATMVKSPGVLLSYQEFQENQNKIEEEFPKETPDAAVLRDILGLVSLHVPLEEIEKWSSKQRDVASNWAALAHFEASNNDVKAGPMPEFLKPFLTSSFFKEMESK